MTRRAGGVADRARCPGAGRERVRGGGADGVLIADGVPHVVNVWVDPAARGRRVADLLLAEVIGWASEQGHPRLALRVVTDNTAAIALSAATGSPRRAALGPTCAAATRC